ncbi:MAG TPA: hypothetical protein VF397_14150 [Pyrinomonadaceae bacterium]
MVDNGQQHFSDKTIRSFLLGELTGGDQSHFEEQLFTDEELAERVRLAELELCDELASKRVGDREQQIFRERFLLTLDRKQALGVSAALGDRFRTKSTEHSFIERIGNLININQAVWKYGFAALILIIVLGTVLLVTKDHHQRIALPTFPQNVAPRPTATATPQFTNHSNGSAAPAHKEQSPELPLHESLAIDAVLTSQTPLDSSAVIKRPDESRRVLMELFLDGPRSESYYINLMTLSGDMVFATDSRMRVDQNKILFYVPGDVMKIGDYQISLTRIDGEAKASAGVYYFRVR